MKKPEPEIRLARYLAIERKLHALYEDVDYCAAVCIPKLLEESGGAPVCACCKDRYYRIYDLDDPAFDLLRAGRERLYGTPESRTGMSTVSPCEYHADTGCVLASHKSPICLAFMCRPAIESMRKEFGIYTYDYLGFNYGLEWILTGDMRESDYLQFVDDLDAMIEVARKVRRG